MSQPLMQVDNLSVHFPLRGGVFGRQVGTVKAVDGVSFQVFEGETLGIVGESGCGKSTLGKALLRLLEPTGGAVYVEGENLLALSKEELRRMRRFMQMIFQDPFASLNPRHTVQKILEEPLLVHGLGSAKERAEQVREMLEVVGLSSYHAKRYPHQFSGGQRQRIGIAKALMTRPKLIIADEPVSALDVSIQAQVLNLLKDLQQEFTLTYIFISHDLGVVRHISDRVAVMYLGQIVELAESESLYAERLHPYTQALLAAVPIPDPKAEQVNLLLSGELPSPSKPPVGCAFHTRCPKRMEHCASAKPRLTEVKPRHFVACHLYD